MIQKNIGRAYPAILRLCEIKLPIKKARELYLIANKMKQHFDFALQEERKAVKEFGGAENLDGTITFSSPIDFTKFQDRMSELNESTVDWDLEKVVLTDAEIGTQTISASDIINLEDFVVFE